jgi:hypothetical protein
MKIVAPRRLLAASFASAFLVTGLGLSPASAATAPTPSPTVEDSVVLDYQGFDAKAAKANGYDIRTDKDGVKYSIKATEPKGSLVGAIYLPGTKAVKPGTITPMNTTFGSCGTATLTGSGRNFYTAYAITDPWLGGAFSHVWRVAVAAPAGYQVFNLDGYAPFFSNTWSTSRYIPFIGRPYNAYVSNGTVVTKSGVVCTAMYPSDSWYS